MNILQSYLLIGIVWSLYWEFRVPEQMSNGRRVRTLLLWPITVVAWCVGFIDAWIKYNDEE